MNFVNGTSYIFSALNFQPKLQLLLFFAFYLLYLLDEGLQFLQVFENRFKEGFRSFLAMIRHCFERVCRAIIASHNILALADMTLHRPERRESL